MASCCTSANVENVVVSILRLDSVHSYLCQLSPARLCLQQDGFAVLGNNWAIHDGVGAHKPQNLVWKFLRAWEATAVHFTGTLLNRWYDRNRVSVRRGSEGDRGGPLTALALYVEQKLTCCSLTQTASAWPAEVATTALTFTGAVRHALNTPCLRVHRSNGECLECIMGRSICKHFLIANIPTHRSGPRVRDSVIVRHPVMLRPLSVGKRTIEGCSDVLHVIDTHCVTFKHRTEQSTLISTMLNALVIVQYKEMLHSPCCAKEAKDFWIFSIFGFENKHILWNPKCRIQSLFGYF